MQCPTLVLHRAADPVVPISRGRALAARIPDAEFVTLTGDDLLEAARALGEGPKPDAEPSRWWRWMS